MIIQHLQAYDCITLFAVQILFTWAIIRTSNYYNIIIISCVSLTYVQTINRAKVFNVHALKNFKICMHFARKISKYALTIRIKNRNITYISCLA